MRIRPAELDDTEAMSDIAKRSYGVYAEAIGRRPHPMDDDYAEKVRRGHAFVADDGGVVGLLVLVPRPDHLLVENVAVDPDRQGEGVGRSLLAHAELAARERGLSVLKLYTNAAMTGNLALYRRLGYREDARRTVDRFNRVYFSKRLSDA